MLNIIWPAFIGISFIYAICAGNVDQINDGIFKSCEEAVKLSISFFRNNVFMEWNHGDCEEDINNTETNENIRTCNERIVSRSKKK